MTMTAKRALEAIKTIVDEMFRDDKKDAVPTTITIVPTPTPKPLTVSPVYFVPTIQEEIATLKEYLRGPTRGWAPTMGDFEKLVDIVDRLEKRQAWVNPSWTFIPPFPVIPASPNGTIPMPYQPDTKPYIGDPPFGTGPTIICGTNSTVSRMRTPDDSETPTENSSLM